MYMAKISQKSKGILYIMAAAFGFAMMSLFVKLAGDLPAFQKAFFRTYESPLWYEAQLLLPHQRFLIYKQ